MTDMARIVRHLARTWLTTDDHRESTEMLRELVRELATVEVVHARCRACGASAIGPYHRREDVLASAASAGWYAGLCPDCADARSI